MTALMIAALHHAYNTYNMLITAEADIVDEYGSSAKDYLSFRK